MIECKPMQFEGRVLDEKAPSGRSGARQRILLIALGVVLAAGLVWSGWNYWPRRFVVFSPLGTGEHQEVGAAVFLDDDEVGEVSAVTPTHLALRLGLSRPQRQKLRDGLVRVTGQRAVWLTTEFVDRRGPLLIDGDVIPVLSREGRMHRRWGNRLVNWLLPLGGAAALGWVWRALRRGSRPA